MPPLTRRDALKTLGVVGAGAFLPPLTGQEMVPAEPDIAFPRAVAETDPASLEVLPLSSTSEVFVPPRGNAFQKFSFDFPEPSVEFGGYRFSAVLFTRENAYSLDRERLKVETTPNGLRLTSDGLMWGGGQERA
ncbi:MAG: twin-arginine translocation signal domain-containing protein, partial [Gemmatimonadaceae bacterium]